MLDDSGPYGVRGYLKAEFIDDLNDEAIAKLVAGGANRPGPMVQLLLEPLGGAIADVDEADSAISRRDVAWCYHALSMWMDPSPEAEDAHVAWARDLTESMKPHTTTGVYLNFTNEDDDDRVRKTFGPEKYARLQALKDKYDPDNLFRLNANIKPSS
jgi:FAD/FMN-containing dehydrogenase